MPRLEKFNLNETPITDAAMGHVAKPNACGPCSSITRRLPMTACANPGYPARSNCVSAGPISATPASPSVAPRSTARSGPRSHAAHGQGTAHVADLTSLERLDLSVERRERARTCRFWLNFRGSNRCGSKERRPVPDVLAAIPKLPALEELYINGPIAPRRFIRNRRVSQTALAALLVSIDSGQYTCSRTTTAADAGGNQRHNLSDAAIEELAACRT